MIFPLHFRWLAWGLVATLALAAPIRTFATDIEDASDLLQARTLTIRIAPTVRMPPAADGAEPAEAPAADQANPAPAGPQRVTVCSGVSLGEGLIVTHFDSSTQGRIRITLPGGAQLEARLKVYDQHTGLALLETTQKDLPGLATLPEGESMRVGGTVLSASAWGTEKPVIAIGHIGGLDRTLAGTSLPPLFQCGLRATETSAGGPVVDAKGRLVGIVVAADAAANASGWVYAIPVEHVVRMRRAAAPGKVVVIPKVRPVVGLVLDTNTATGSVVVMRVEKGGPAEKAGMEVGDRVLAMDGLVVRHAYQVTTPVLQKRPGDKISFLYERGGVQKKAEIQLGGSFAVKEQPSSDTIQIAELFNAKVKVGFGPDGRFGIDRGVQMRDLGIGGDNAPAAAARKEEDLMVKAQERLGKLVIRLLDDVKTRDEKIKALEAEIERLKAGQK